MSEAFFKWPMHENEGRIALKQNRWVKKYLIGRYPYEKEVFGGLELLYRRNPDLKLLYSHTAMSNSKNVRRILKTYPHVMMSIKIETRHDRWRNLEPVVNAQGNVYEDWAQLFEKMPERFMMTPRP